MGCSDRGRRVSYDGGMSQAGSSAVASSASNREGELAAIVALERSRPKGIAPWRVARYVEELGSAHTALTGGFIDVDPAAYEQARLDVGRWLADGIDMRSVLDVEYPGNLRGAFDSPPYLTVRGELDDEWARRAVAVVGTRNASPEGAARARRVARTLVDGGYAVLSGLAKGIDRQAHEAAIDAGGRTVAVMGTGLGKVYPAEHKPLAQRIIERGGALVSQFEPGSSGARHHFPMRNATMSGLALATVVVEAGETSGAKIQALAGLKHGSSVFLLRSLVDQQEWARDLSTRGRHGSVAVVLDDVDQLMSALEAHQTEREPISIA